MTRRNTGDCRHLCLLLCSHTSWKVCHRDACQAADECCVTAGVRAGRGTVTSRVVHNIGHSAAGLIATFGITCAPGTRSRCTVKMWKLARHLRFSHNLEMHSEWMPDITSCTIQPSAHVTRRTVAFVMCQPDTLGNEYMQCQYVVWEGPDEP